MSAEPGIPSDKRRSASRQLLMALGVATLLCGVASATEAEPTQAVVVGGPLAEAAGADIGPGTTIGEPGSVRAFRSDARAALPGGERPARSDVARPAPSGAAVLPDRIDTSPRVRQMITVTARGFSSTGGTLRAWARTPGGAWQLKYGPVPAVVGYNGWVVAAKRRQGTGTTPAGVFNLPSAFGRSSDPGSALRYRHVDANDWWPYEPRDPATYNIYQEHKARGTHWRGDMAERLNSYTRQYAYAMVVGFNLARGVHYSDARRQWVATRRANTRLGGGIFLHVRGDGQTAGCVAVARANMRWLLRWVRPGEHPKIAMGPRPYLVGL